MRLTFHDCVGGCDGCINIDNPHNAGLQDAIDVVEDVYQVVESDGIVVSRADLWAICGRAAAEYGMEISGDVRSGWISFKYASGFERKL